MIATATVVVGRVVVEVVVPGVVVVVDCTAPMVVVPGVEVVVVVVVEVVVVGRTLSVVVEGRTEQFPSALLIGTMTNFLVCACRSQYALTLSLWFSAVSACSSSLMVYCCFLRHMLLSVLLW